MENVKPDSHFFEESNFSYVNEKGFAHYHYMGVFERIMIFVDFENKFIVIKRTDNTKMVSRKAIVHNGETNSSN